MGTPVNYPPLNLGPLPVDMINRTLGTELEAGNARMSSAAHKHMAEDHPDDYEYCVPRLTEAIANPTFIGQDPKHTRNFILVKRFQIGEQKHMLVAISLTQNIYGNYNIRTAYLTPEESIYKRRASGHLKIPLPK